MLETSSHSWQLLGAERVLVVLTLVHCAPREFIA